MYTLHPDKIAAVNNSIGKKPKPVTTPPVAAPKRTYDLRPNLVEALAARLHAAQSGGGR